MATSYSKSDSGKIAAKGGVKSKKGIFAFACAAVIVIAGGAFAISKWTKKDKDKGDGVEVAPIVNLVEKDNIPSLRALPAIMDYAKSGNLPFKANNETQKFEANVDVALTAYEGSVIGAKTGVHTFTFSLNNQGQLIENGEIFRSFVHQNTDISEFAKITKVMEAALNGSLSALEELGVGNEAELYDLIKNGAETVDSIKLSKKVISKSQNGEFSTQKVALALVKANLQKQLDEIKNNASNDANEKRSKITKQLEAIDNTGAVEISKLENFSVVNPRNSTDKTMLKGDIHADLDVMVKYQMDGAEKVLTCSPEIKTCIELPRAGINAKNFEEEFLKIGKDRIFEGLHNATAENGKIIIGGDIEFSDTQVSEADAVKTSVKSANTEKYLVVRVGEGFEALYDGKKLNDNDAAEASIEIEAKIEDETMTLTAEKDGATITAVVDKTGQIISTKMSQAVTKTKLSGSTSTR